MLRIIGSVEASNKSLGLHNTKHLCGGELINSQSGSDLSVTNLTCINRDFATELSLARNSRIFATEEIIYEDALKIPYKPLPLCLESPKSITKTKIDGVFEIKRSVIEDKERSGYFSERLVFTELSPVLGYIPVIVQQNESGNKEAGILRGLHIGPWTKIVSCTKGSAFVAVADCRIGSPTRGEIYTTTLVGGDGKRLHVPAGVAHGYQALEADTVYSYETDERWQPGREKGIAYNSPELAIPWPVEKAILKKADLENPVFVM